MAASFPTLFSLFGCALISLGVLAQENTPLTQCVASKEYLAELKRYSLSLKAEQDYSCLTNFPNIAKKLKDYQLVDTRSMSGQVIDGAWSISVDELKLKTFLNNRPLLLLGEGFSRAKQASDCMQLKKAGFSSIKMLVGGTSQWQRISHPKMPRPELQLVTANDMIFEYFNGRVLVVAASHYVSTELNSLGITNHTTLQVPGSAALANIAITSSGGGFDPVVYVGTVAKPLPDKITQDLPNLYILQGGVNALASQLHRDVMINASRMEAEAIPYCAR